MNRRNFTKVASCGALLTGTLSSVSHAATENRPLIPGSLGILYDSTLCVDCQACVTKCQDTNSPEHNPQEEQIWSSDDKPSPCTNNIIQMRTSSTGINKDQKENGYAYIKKQCMHYVDPNCISACPVSALKRDSRTDIVHYDKDVCTDCHYCMATYPYNVSEYDYNNPLGALYKCKLCNQKGAEHLDKGGLPDCVEMCSAGAVIFGTHEGLMAEAEKRPTLKPGNEYHYPRQTLKSGNTCLHMMPKYYPHLCGEKEGGGTQVLILTGVPCEDFNLPKLDDPPTDACSEHVQHTLYKDMMLPLAVLAGLTVPARRNTRGDHHDGGGGHES